jgi:hypothetical protein
MQRKSTEMQQKHQNAAQGTETNQNALQITEIQRKAPTCSVKQRNAAQSIEMKRLLHLQSVLASALVSLPLPLALSIPRLRTP